MADEDFAMRHRLPNRRPCDGEKVVWSGPGAAEHRLHICLGFYDPAARIPAEVFASHEKSTSLLDGVVQDGAVLLSMLRQYGVPFRVIAESLGHELTVDGRIASISPLGAICRLAAAREAGDGGFQRLPDLKPGGTG